MRKFPVISLFIREIASRDLFAADCVIRQAVLNYADSAARSRRLELEFP
jgi:hypothetical protein